ncbi:lysophospholipid acyltransferase family protein [Variovorax dokdonensis]|uniref:Lysophospholipid acyltransferase family protein n=1 Tax=Variovorax dokdonensis TaxID=344883 RepID=A0ABT7N5B2_9BURK|nr:lysophospholipid acyltransferase family protein [Variovorax dokdonensis]MDM0043123.1 lysophospholipid acyltransferase family protein [Variovorax dokdonensis]
MLRPLRVIWRLLLAIGHAIRGWCIITFRFPRQTPEERAGEVERWSRRMLEIFGISLVVQGVPPARGPLLLVVNHLSWLDILVIHSARHVRFVAKSDIRGWPLIGKLATGAGTLYIERERRRDAMRVVHHMAESLQAGDLIAVFPEGTTGDGKTLLPFHANLLQAAISTCSPVQPAALRFADRATGQTSFAPRYIDDDTLASSVWRTLSAPPLAAYLCFGDVQDAQGKERRAWSQELHAQIQALRGHQPARQADDLAA